MLTYLFTIRFKRYYMKRREYMFILALNKFLSKEVLVPLRSTEVKKPFHSEESYRSKELIDLRFFLMMSEVFHRVLISTHYNFYPYALFPI